MVLLDLTLPGMDGLDVCKSLRESTKLPIIISSARGDVSDKVIGLQLGADDYLPKPYDPKELYARILSVMRRYGKQGESGGKNKKRDVLAKIGQAVYDAHKSQGSYGEYSALFEEAEAIDKQLGVKQTEMDAAKKASEEKEKQEERDRLARTS